MVSIILPWCILPFKTQNKPVNFNSLDVHRVLFFYFKTEQCPNPKILSCICFRFSHLVILQEINRNNKNPSGDVGIMWAGGGGS